MSSEKESKTLAVVNCSQLVTLADRRVRVSGRSLRELGIIANGGMFVRDGLIERVGSRDEIETLIDGDTEVVDALGVCVARVVDAHTHPVFGGTRVDEFEERSKARRTRRSPRVAAGFSRLLMRHACNVRGS